MRAAHPYVLEHENESERLARQSASFGYSLDDELAAHDGDLRAVETVLDAGCGSGVGVRWLRQRYPHLQVTAVDRSADRLLDAQRAVEDPGVRWVCADLETFALAPPDRVDRVLFRYVFQHLTPAARARVLANARDWIRPGGKIIAVDFDTTYETLSIESPAFVRWFREIQDDGRVDLQVLRKLPQEARDAGFGDVAWDLRVIPFNTRARLEGEVRCVNERILQIVPEGAARSAILAEVARWVEREPVLYFVSGTLTATRA